jgi:large subunit ribosomal protein L6
MSRIGKKEIAIPDKVKVNVSNGTVNIEGPLGKLSYKLVDGISVETKDGKIFVHKNPQRNDLSAIYGTTRAKLNNMVEGVTKGFSKNLEIMGVGFKGMMQGNSLSLQVGFSHPVIVDIPVGIKVNVDPKQTLVTVSGIDKDLVGNFASKIKKIKVPEPYKGTGIKYQGERILRKAGKSAAAAGAKK